jgi:hypothetical protein
MIVVIWVLVSFGVVLTPCLLKFYRDIIKLENENDALREQLLKEMDRTSNYVKHLEDARKELTELKSQF